MGTASEQSKKQQLLRCVDWLQKQNSQEPKKLSLQNQNDIQFIIQTNAARKNFLLAAAEDDATVPAGIDESPLEPQNVPIKRLRVDYLRMQCEWQSCQHWFNDYEELQKHVREHTASVHVIKDEEDAVAKYVCLWDVCGHKTPDFTEMVRHMNYHAYHARLLAIGFNGRATLNLARCRKDSSKRNQLPALNCEHCCMWTDCDNRTFNSIQGFFDHVKLHVQYSDDNVCSWAGCGASFPRKVLLTMHVRSHTKERLIACYHCGMHFSCNRTLGDHLLRQNVYAGSTHVCGVCGTSCASAYLLREHARQHISAHACHLCDMSAPSPAALAQHVRYRHVASAARTHQCPHCQYRAVTKSDLKKHIPTHSRKRKLDKNELDSDRELSDDDGSLLVERKKKKSNKKYACHMCPKKEMKVFSRGTRLTTHLVKVHGAQWPFGHSRFRYQISEDGMYRLTTTRYEFLEVSKKIVDGYSWPKESHNNSFEFNLELKAEPTRNTPRRFEITLKNQNDDDSDHQKNIKTENDSDHQENIQSESDRHNSDHHENIKAESGNDIKTEVEITMCDVDEHGNIVQSKVINSNLIS